MRRTLVCRALDFPCSAAAGSTGSKDDSPETRRFCFGRRSAVNADNAEPVAHHTRLWMQRSAIPGLRAASARTGFSRMSDRVARHLHGRGNSRPQQVCVLVDRERGATSASV